MILLHVLLTIHESIYASNYVQSKSWGGGGDVDHRNYKNASSIAIRRSIFSSPSQQWYWTSGAGRQLISPSKELDFLSLQTVDFPSESLVSHMPFGLKDISRLSTPRASSPRRYYAIEGILPTRRGGFKI